MKSKEIQPPQCPNCGATVVRVKDKDYYGCPNWAPQGRGCEGTIWFQPGLRKSSAPNIVFTHKVESKSNPGHFHIVKVYESGDMDCPCIAGRQGKFCRHDKQTIADVEEVLQKIKDRYLRKNEVVENSGDKQREKLGK